MGSMLRLLQLILSLTLLYDVSWAAKVLPRGYYGQLYRPAFAELHNVMINPRGERHLTVRGAGPYPRSFHPANRSKKRNAAALDARDVLLGKRQTCQAGYSLCTESGRCCPDPNDNGRCCDDGTCITSGDVCCTNGGSCASGEDCCDNSCMPEGNVCCTGDWNCDPGYKCCGDDNCAPEGGECCEGRTSCDPGLHCVLLNGIQGCCKDLSCSEFDSSGDSSDTPDSSFTVPRITVPSYTRTLATADSSRSQRSFTETDTIFYESFSYYYTTYTFYYYSFFVTTIRASETPTSTRITTTTTLSVYASGTADASEQFSSLSSIIAPITATTAPGFASATAAISTGTHSSARTSAAAAGGGGGGGGGSPTPTGNSGGGAASPATRVDTHLILGLWTLLAAIVGAGMILL